MLDYYTSRRGQNIIFRPITLSFGILVLCPKLVDGNVDSLLFPAFFQQSNTFKMWAPASALQTAVVLQ